MKPLRIAVDARPLALPMVGITRYTHELLSRLVNSPHQWFLYLDREPIHPIPSLPNVHIRYGSMKRRALSTFFAQLVFPIWARKDQIDVFWSPRHHLPLLLSRRIKKLLTVHDLVWKHHPETMSLLGRWVERLLMPASLKSAHRVMTVSVSTQQDVESNFPDCADKLSTVYPGLSFVPVKIKTVPNKVPYFLFVGTLEPRKNLLRLIRAFSLFVEHDQNCNLVIVGGKGWGGEQLQNKINILGLEDRIILMDRIGEQELAMKYANAIALVMPSLYEGFGLPLLESMGHGVPVISSNIGAMAEVVAGAGLLIDPYSESAIASAMQEMLNDNRRKVFSQHAISRAADFCWDDSVSQVLAEIEHCVEMGSS